VWVFAEVVVCLCRARVRQNRLQRGTYLKVKNRHSLAQCGLLGDKDHHTGTAGGTAHAKP
jgi:hypothetical protein